MSNTAIKVENLSKIYRLGEIGTGSIGQDVDRWFKTKVLGKEDPFLKIGEANNRATKGSSDFVYSLQDINFEINQGDAVGIIGRNGAGKSTLLKILSRVTTPTTGKINIKGRVASLLEVGTGFHPELTGRENIYLNGAILGMRKREIDRKLDEIIEFSGVERYIDTPVKRYSSGMYVRLAFAVAAHLESEILIVDEVLAVGDAEFQKKCLGKMGEISKGDGRTVLFVSHNMAAVKQLCTKGIVLGQGKLKFAGTQIESVGNYQKVFKGKSAFIHEGILELAPGNNQVRILNFGVQPLIGESITISSGIVFELQFYNYKIGSEIGVTFELKSTEEIIVFHHGTSICIGDSSKEGVYKIKGILPPNFLNSGNYVFNLIFGENQRYLIYQINDFIQFEVFNETFGSNSNVLPGVTRPDIEYSILFNS
jgi:lipopolysaccharide transport system ATP-binding protein